MKLTKNLLTEWYLSRRLIRSGPFRGARVESYSETVGRPKWLGTYEKELHPVWRKILATSPKRIFDIGGAEGYYACALLYLLPNATLDVWETLDRERGLLRDNSIRSGISHRLVIHGHCDPPALEHAVMAACPDLLICDIEGGERELLTEGVLRTLQRTTLVVETHGLDVYEEILERVRMTHDTEVCEPRPRTVADWPLPWIFYATETYKHYAVQEHRVMPTPWIIGWPRGRSEGAMAPA